MSEFHNFGDARAKELHDRLGQVPVDPAMRIANVEAVLRDFIVRVDAVMQELEREILPLLRSGLETRIAQAERLIQEIDQRTEGSRMIG